jgi:hypothetical protein
MNENEAFYGSDHSSQTRALTIPKALNLLMKLFFREKVPGR